MTRHSQPTFVEAARTALGCSDRHDLDDRCRCANRYNRDGPFCEVTLAEDSQFPRDVTREQALVLWCLTLTPDHIGDVRIPPTDF